MAPRSRSRRRHAHHRGELPGVGARRPDAHCQPLRQLLTTEHRGGQPDPHHHPPRGRNEYPWGLVRGWPPVRVLQDRPRHQPRHLVLSSEGVAEPFVVTPANERTPYPSPDGRFIAYVSDESGRDEVTSAATPTRAGGGRSRRTAGENQSGRRMAPSYFPERPANARGRSFPGETFQSDAPRVLFEARYGVDATGLPDYDVSKDGQRFLMVTDTSPRELRIITNWGDELSRLTRP